MTTQSRVDVTPFGSSLYVYVIATARQQILNHINHNQHFWWLLLWRGCAVGVNGGFGGVPASLYPIQLLKTPTSPLPDYLPSLFQSNCWENLVKTQQKSQKTVCLCMRGVLHITSPVMKLLLSGGDLDWHIARCCA